MGLKGFDEFKQKMGAIQKNIDRLNGNIPLSDLLTPPFMLKNTRFSSGEELFEMSGFDIKNEEDFTRIPEDEWDAYIKSVSVFETFEAMLTAATAEYLAEVLGL